MKYEATFWGKLLRKVEQCLPIHFNYSKSSDAPHPWQIRPIWHKNKSGKGGEWRGVITAGAVNGLPAYVKMRFEEAPKAAQDRVKLDAIKNKEPAPRQDQLVNIYLDEQAEIAFRWRKIGTDASAESISTNSNTGAVTGVFEKVPEFFKRMGVSDANTNILGDTASTTRLLRACDIVLNQPRVSLTNNVSISSIAIDTTLVSIDPGISTPIDSQPHVTALAKYVKLTESTSFADLLFQRFIDTPYDQIHLSTAYLLSPALPLEDPDDLSSWQCYLKYNCHHNLVHATQQVEKRDEFVPLTLTVPFAGGVAQPLINYILAENNFFAQAALDFYQQRKLAGRFHAI